MANACGFERSAMAGRTKFGSPSFITTPRNLKSSVKEMKAPIKINKIHLAKSQSASKPKTPVVIQIPVHKSLEEAIDKMKFTELKNVIDMSRQQYPHSPVQVLDDLISFLNLKLNVKDADPLYTARPNTYPLNICSKELTELIENILSQCTPDVLVTFFERVLEKIAEDGAKGLSTHGYRIVIQAVMFRHPRVVLQNINEMVKLRNVYKKNQSSCLNFLWAIGQVGVKNFKSGLRVWMEVMLPLLGIKVYSKHIVCYLKDLISWHEHGSENLEIQKFFPLMDVIFSSSVNLDASLRRDLVLLYPKIKKLALGSNCSRHFFPSFLTRLDKSCPLHFKNELLSNLTECLVNDGKCFRVWGELFNKHVSQSYILLDHLSANWEMLWTKLPREIMFDALRKWCSFTSKDAVDAKGSHLGECNQICKELLAKMQPNRAKNQNSNPRHKNRGNVQNSPQPRFPWILIIFVSLTALAGLVMYDITTKGSFKASHTQRMLNDSGISDFGQTAWKFTKYYSVSTVSWCKTNVPAYYKTAVDFLAPYAVLARAKSHAFALSFLNLIDALNSNVSQITQPALIWVDVNVPPFLRSAWQIFLDFLTYVWSLLVPLGTTVAGYLHCSYTWVMENVLTGQLAPQNLQKSAISAVGAVQEYTVNTFKWLSQQVFSS